MPSSAQRTCLVENLVHNIATVCQVVLPREDDRGDLDQKALSQTRTRQLPASVQRGFIGLGTLYGVPQTKRPTPVERDIL